jgi:hypothetical protein
MKSTLRRQKCMRKSLQTKCMRKILQTKHKDAKAN